MIEQILASHGGMAGGNESCGERRCGRGVRWGGVCMGGTWMCTQAVSCGAEKGLERGEVTRGSGPAGGEDHRTWRGETVCVGGTGLQQPSGMWAGLRGGAGGFGEETGLGH
jgi:hypothetical protein